LQRAEKKPSLRKCIGCGEMFPKKDLVRIVHTPENEIVLDFTGKKNGRGAYLCNNESCLDKAFKSKAVNRAFKMNVASEIYDALKEAFKVVDKDE
jgi:predicted RNA-binding protein YlxR (DUF448 family)